jgi:hypothetical protein
LGVRDDEVAVAGSRHDDLGEEHVHLDGLAGGGGGGERPADAPIGAGRGADGDDAAVGGGITMASWAMAALATISLVPGS